MDNPDFKFHPYAEIFPLMEGREFDDLVADIKAHGLLEPIVLWQDQIIDGRNRYRACMAAGADCPSVKFTDIDGSDDISPLDYVISHNLKRRHLNESQRAMVAAKLATLKRGDNQHSPIGETSQSQAADLLNVGKRSVERAKEVRERGASELQEAVERGQVSVSAAADIASRPQDEQRKIVVRGEREILDAAKQIRAERAFAKRAEKLAETSQLAKRNKALPAGERKYSVIYADPPWSFAVWSGAGKDRAAENHYPTMSQTEIEALPVGSLAADDCALFLWCVMPQLPEALRVIESWGFSYKTCAFVWVKRTREEKLATGMGYWTRANAELCLLATRGSPQRLNADVHQVVESPRLEHSEKPEEVAARIQRLVPGPYIELFARKNRHGWDAWGNQAQPGALSIPPLLRRASP
jgi:N6-adenosine-specific RNA methylase IME4/ParB-like chromosome segregation protein Spo0J